MRMPLRYFAGFRRTPHEWIIPMPIAQVQTDGSFFSRSRSGAVAALVDLPSGSTHPYVQRLDHLTSSTEAEWASIYYGLAMAQQLDQQVVGLENDCLGVIRSILFDSPGKQDYAKYYNYKIHRLGRELEWCGIRWIPRSENKADALFKNIRSEHGDRLR